MSLIEVVLGGVITGGLYALIAVGFNLNTASLASSIWPMASS